jgi:hypothetical protein
MKNTARIALLIYLITHIFGVNGQTFTKEQFKDPSIEYWPRPLWFWNAAVTEDEIASQMQNFRDRCGYGGFGILPFQDKFHPGYLSEEYFEIYKKALETAKQLGMTMCLYDEFGFPSGSAGAGHGDGIPRFQQLYPDETIGQLNKIEKEINSSALYETDIPEGKLMGVVAMEVNSLKRIDITGQVANGKLRWNVPAGKWKIMIFNCVKSNEPIVDYLNPLAVKHFTNITHNVYYDHFKAYFGSVISGTFFDEPSMFHAQRRMWTVIYNDEFENKYGFSPVMLYPALWYDIGLETQSARNYLFGFRAELYAKGFTKEVNDWSVAHGVTATGHTAPEEVLNPVNSSGDLMKSFKYLEIPGIDKIGGNRPAERFYKIISSSAYNFDKSLVMSETYGAMGTYGKEGDLTWNEILSIAMDQYAKGINMLIPHAVWYDVNNVTYKPELSHRNPLYVDSLKVFNQFLSRLNLMLQNNGRHVADIAILYPIHTLQGDHFFDGPKGPANEWFKGDVAVTKIDYDDVSNWLTEYVGKDFTFIHPEVLDEKCSVIDGILHLENKINWEEYKILVIPSCKTISVSNLQKIKDFYERGGSIVFTTRLPSIAVEKGKNEEVVNLIRSIFPNMESSQGIIYMSNKEGKALYISEPSAKNLRESLTEICSDFDVNYPVNEDIRYIHKVIEGQDVFYFANTGSESANLPVSLRGNLKLQRWDPHTGNITNIKINNNFDSKTLKKSTIANLSLKPFQSCFWVGEVVNN